MSPSSGLNKEQLDTPALDNGVREAERLAALDHLNAIQPETDHILQQLVDEVRSIFGTDLCMVNLNLSDVQYFRAWSGELDADLAEARQDALEHSMCRYVVDSEMPLVVEDFLATEEFREQHWCVNYGIHFYAGTPLTTSDGHTIGTLCLLNAQPIEFGEEQLKALTVFSQAVVGRLELLGALAREQAAKRKEVQRTHELQRTLDASSDMIFTISSEGVFRSMSKASKTLLGYEPEELVGRRFIDLIYPDDREFGRATTTMDDGASTQTFEGRCSRKDGSIAWIEWNTRYLSGEDMVYCIAREITERKRAEAVQRKSEELIRRLLANFPNGSVNVFDRDLRYRLAEGQGLAQVGLSPEMLVGKTLGELFPEEQVQAHPGLLSSRW